MHCERGCILLGLALVVGLSCLGLVSDALAQVNEDARFDASDGAAGDTFGYSIGFDGTRPIAGARKDDASRGAAYVFEPDGGGGYTEVKKLVPTDAVAGDMAGSSAVISGDLAFVGGYMADITVGLDVYADAGAVWVFERNSPTPDAWGQVAKIVADTPVAGAGFGSSMAFDGNTLLICAQNETGGEGEEYSGAGYVFQDVGGTWTQLQRLQASDFDYKDYFGQSCGIDGDTLAIGAHGGNKAYVFQDDGMGNWVERKILTAAGSKYMGTGTTIQGDTVVVGACQTVVNEVNKAGTAYVFDRDKGGEDNWGQVAQLLPSEGPQAGAYFGVGTAIDGDKIIVGAYGQDGQGAVYAYGKTAGAWIEIAKLVASDGWPGDKLGNRVALVGDTAVVGASGAVAGAETGAAYTFTVPDVEELIPGDANNDGSVNAADAQRLAENWGATELNNPPYETWWEMGDFDNDHFVGPADAAIMAANWGYTSPTEATAVPEPAALTLLAAGIILLAFLRRGRRG